MLQPIQTLQRTQTEFFSFLMRLFADVRYTLRSIRITISFRHPSDALVPVHVKQQTKFQRYFHNKVLVLAIFTICLYIVKTFFAVELPEKYLALVEHASLFSDLIFMGSSRE